MRFNRRHDFHPRPSPQPEPGDDVSEERWHTPPQAPLEERLASEIFVRRQDGQALEALLREVPPQQRMTARVVAIRHLGAERAAELCARAFGPGQAVFPFVPAKAEPREQPRARASYDYARARGLADVLTALLRVERDPAVTHQVGELLTSADRHVALATLSHLRGNNLFAPVDAWSGGQLAKVASAMQVGGRAGSPAPTSTRPSWPQRRVEQWVTSRGS